MWRRRLLICDSRGRLLDLRSRRRRHWRLWCWLRRWLLCGGNGLLLLSLAAFRHDDRRCSHRLLLRHGRLLVRNRWLWWRHGLCHCRLLRLRWWWLRGHRLLIAWLGVGRRLLLLWRHGLRHCRLLRLRLWWWWRHLLLVLRLRRRRLRVILLRGRWWLLWR